jgi:hypothetical protein
MLCAAEVDEDLTAKYGIGLGHMKKQEDEEWKEIVNKHRRDLTALERQRTPTPPLDNGGDIGDQDDPDPREEEVTEPKNDKQRDQKAKNDENDDKKGKKDDKQGKNDGKKGKHDKKDKNDPKGKKRKGKGLTRTPKKPRSKRKKEFPPEVETSKLVLASVFSKGRFSKVKCLPT